MKKKFLTLFLTAFCFTAIVFPQNVKAASWKHDNTGWWYQEDNGSYPRNQWRFLNGRWYWFESNGYMATGWKKINKSWFYFNTNGCMADYGWNQIGDSWYYMQKDGSMTEKGWHKIGSFYYYMYNTGAMAKNAWIGNDYVNEDGVWIPEKKKYTEGWKKSGNRWWYCHSDGTYTKNGWEKIKEKYYYFDNNGYMITGWKKFNGNWYYLKADGSMMSNGWMKIQEKWYYFKLDGSMNGKGWHKINGSYYYMDATGAMASDVWIDNYYIPENGQWKNKVDHIRFVSSRMSNYATITAYSSNGSVVWKYSTPHYKEMDATQVCEIGRKNDRYFLVEGRSIVALNSQTGQVLWRNSDFGSLNAASAIGKDALYLCSGFSMDFYAVSFEGETLKTIKQFNKQYFWPYKITIQGNRASVYFSGDSSVGYIDPARIFYVDLDTYKYWKA